MTRLLLGIVILTMLVATLVLTLTWKNGGAERVDAADPARPEFVMSVDGVSGCTTKDPAPTAKGDVVCTITVGSEFAVVTEIQDIGTDLGGQYDGRQYVIDWSGSIAGPPDISGIDNSACLAIGVAQTPSFLGRTNTAAVACAAIAPLTNTGAASRSAFQFGCTSIGQGLVRMLVGTGPSSLSDPNYQQANAPQNNTNLLNSFADTDKDGTEVLTINCVPGPTATPLPTATPPSTPEPAKAVSIAAGGTHSCAVTSSGSVKCWGAVYGPVPVVVQGIAGPVDDISAGVSHVCAVTAGAAQCWGGNGSGQLGDGTQIGSPLAVKVVGLSTGVTDISAGSVHSCAVTATGGVKCWGKNHFGQLGDGTTSNSTTPVDVQGLGSGAVSVEAGLFHTCAVTVTASVKCWGRNFSGQLGDGTTIDSTTPVDVQVVSGPIATVSAGGRYTCAVRVAGSVSCWGALFASLGGPGTVSMVSAGHFYTCVVTTTNAAKCRGENLLGELGDGTTTERGSLVDVVGLSGGVSAISASPLGHTCALVEQGGVMCWGANDVGQLGYTSNETCANVPCSTTPHEVVGFSPKSVGGFSVDLAQANGQSLRAGSLVLALAAGALALGAVAAGAVSYSRRGRSGGQH